MRKANGNMANECVSRSPITGCIYAYSGSAAWRIPLRELAFFRFTDTPCAHAQHKMASNSRGDVIAYAHSWCNGFADGQSDEVVVRLSAASVYTSVLSADYGTATPRVDWIDDRHLRISFYKDAIIYYRKERVGDIIVEFNSNADK